MASILLILGKLSTSIRGRAHSCYYDDINESLPNMPQTSPKSTVPKQIKKPRPLTYKQKAFIKHIVDNPKSSATQAAKAAYGNGIAPITDGTAEQIAFDNLRKPSIVSALATHNQLIENTLINTVNDYKDSEKIPERSLAVDTAKYIHDKIHGKAKQSIETTTTGVTLTIDLTSSLTGVDQPTEPTKQV